MARIFFLKDDKISREMKTETVILDFDGTMGDSQHLIVTTLQTTIGECRLPSRTDAQCAATIGLPLWKAFVVLFGMSDADGQRCADVYRRIFMENKKNMAVKPFPHVIETIRRLHGLGVTVAIASSRSRQSLVEYVEQYGIVDCIACIVASDDVEKAKPAPDMVLKVLADTGGKPESALTVGDMTYDIDMGKAAGTKTCGVTYGNGTLLELSSADFLIDDFSELLNVIDK